MHNTQVRFNIHATWVITMNLTPFKITFATPLPSDMWQQFDLAGHGSHYLKFGIDWSSKLRENNERKNTLDAHICVPSDAY